MDNKNYKKLLGLKIKQYRNNLGLTQEELAEKINRTQRQISLLELGKSFPNYETLICLTEQFNCSLSDLFNFDTTQNIVNIKENLIDLIQNISDEKIKILYVIGKNI